jgi:hypothetical protein
MGRTPQQDSGPFFFFEEKRSFIEFAFENMTQRVILFVTGDKP